MDPGDIEGIPSVFLLIRLLSLTVVRTGRLESMGSRIDHCSRQRSEGLSSNEYKNCTWMWG